MELPRKHIVNRDRVASIFLDLASAHRVRASKMLSDDGKLSDEMIMKLKDDIVNLTKLDDLTKEEKEDVGFNIYLLNMILDQTLLGPRFKFFTLDQYWEGRNKEFMEGNNHEETTT